MRRPDQRGNVDIMTWSRRPSALAPVAFVIACGTTTSSLPSAETTVPVAARSGPAQRNPAQADRLMQIGSELLAKADALELESRGYITRGNKLRQLIGQLRVEHRKAASKDSSKTVNASLGALAEQIEQWQTGGAQLRLHGQALRTSASMLLIEGFDARWAKWISNPSPLVMEAVETQIVAHNNKIRSVHPTLSGLTPSTGDMPKKHQGMSIRVPRLTGQQPPKTLNVSSFQVSRERRFFTHIEVEPQANGQPASVPLNRIHKWRLLVSDLSGRPIDNAAIEVVGHMPGHVHGLPTQPAITGQVAPGVYRVDGMKFQMNGWWVIQFNVDHNGQKDFVRYNLLL